jgi:hypothetical protein
MNKLLIASVFSLLFSSANSAWATGYWMNQNASACKPASYQNGGSNWPVGYDVDYGSYGSQPFAHSREIGTGTSNAALYCPLVVFGSISSVYAYVWDKSTTANVSCTVYAFDDAGNVEYQETRSTSGSSNTDTFQLSWDLTGVTSKYASMACTVPKRLADDPVGGSRSGISQMLVFP